MCDREPLLKRPHRGNRLPSSCKSIEVGGAIQIISEGPDKPILQFGPDGFGDCPKPVKWPKPRIPELFNEKLDGKQINIICMMVNSLPAGRSFAAVFLARILGEYMLVGG